MSYGGTGGGGGSFLDTLASDGYDGEGDIYVAFSEGNGFISFSFVETVNLVDVPEPASIWIVAAAALATAALTRRRV